MWPALISLLPGLLDKILPDPGAAAEAKLKLMELAQKGELAQLDADMRLALGQLEVNKAEAASGSLFTAGWRPAIGWICAAGLAYEFLISPLLPWLLSAALGRALPELPDLPTETLMTLLLGMLGLGGLRTIEKVKGAEANR
jgi:hypothetical protein